MKWHWVKFAGFSQQTVVGASHQGSVFRTLNAGFCLAHALLMSLFLNKKETYRMRVIGIKNRLLSILFFYSISAPGLSSVRPWVYGYHPESVFQLGRGFDPNRIDQIKSACLSFDFREDREIKSHPTILAPGLMSGASLGSWSGSLSDPQEASRWSNGAVITELDTYLVTDSQKIRQALGWDLSMEATFLGIGGGTSIRYQPTGSSQKDRLTLVMRAQSEYARRFATAPSPAPFAKEWLTQKQYDDWIENCGTHYIAMERMGASVSAVIEIDGVSDETLEVVAQSNHLEAGIGPVSGKIKSAISQELSRAASHRKLQINVFATGGTGIAGLAPILESVVVHDRPIEAIASKMGEFLKSFDAKYATSIGFVGAPIPFLPLEKTAIPVFSEKKERLLAIADQYRKIRDFQSRLNRLLNGTNPQQRHFSYLVLDRAESEQAELKDLLHEYWRQHDACLQASDAQSSPCESQPAHVPRYSQMILNALDLIAELGKTGDQP